MITKWKLANFKCIKQETELNLAPLTILAGPNSSGKSTLLQSILLIAQTLSSKVNSPSVVLSGDFVELGQFSEVRSFQGESEPVSIGWECTPIFKHIGQGDWIELEPFEEEISCTVTFDIQGEASSQVRTSGQPALFKTVLSVTAPAKRTETQMPKSTATLVVKRDVSTSPQPMNQIENDDISNFKVELDDNSQREINKLNPTQPPISVVGCELHDFLPATLALKWDNSGEPLIMRVQTPYGIFEAIKYLRLFFAGQVKYLGPLRDKPGFIYPICHNSVDVGTHGQYTAAMLNRYKESQVDYIPSNIFKTPKELSTVSAVNKVECALAKAVIDWLKYLDVAESVETHDRGFGYELKVILPGIAKPLDLVHVGTGVSQVLPLLVMCLLAPMDSTLIIEQPELHLHPAVQTRLGDFFLAMALSGKQCLIETHSEYLINRLRLRLALAQDDSLNALLKTYFVEKIGLESSFREVLVNEYGAIKDWPEGFFDQSQSEAEAIIMASMSKRKARRREKSNV
jgi:predicted ATPase